MSSHFNWDENPDLNITPLVDIMLVLLAILMVTAPVVVYQEEITLPRGSKSSKVQEDSKI
ncbi:MAG: biopolymer transporter ExbD, partial [Helicobacter sp.]|nr:biopolymer transporter ExbD [Helicobacter sp.]